MRIWAMARYALLAMAGSTAVVAQMGMGPSSAPAPGTIVEPSKSITSELDILQSEMMGVVKTMPAEKYGFAPSAAIFVPGQKTEFATVRTFVEQVTHVAQANYSMFAAASGMKPDTDVAAIGKLMRKEDAEAALAGSFAFGHKAIATLTVANAFEAVKSGEPGIQTRATLAEFAIGHGYDHYGQMVEYLRMNGMVPPASAK